VRRARDRAAEADLVLWLNDGAAAWGTGPAGLGARDSTGESSSGPAIWLIHNKIDLVGMGGPRNESNEKVFDRNEPRSRTNESLPNRITKGLISTNESQFIKNDLEFSLSAKTGAGVDRLLVALMRHAEQDLAGAEQALVTRARHRQALEETLAALKRALGPDLSAREDLVAEELRLAARALGRLTGRVDVENILDVIFRDFCIGK